mmetsp:Transcript_31932/g.73650  ORF Transcript_31932/g.73650 Transcript_31932/m.73650 type:complete len:138 (-) Transcript_31932:136-549(-)
MPGLPEDTTDLVEGGPPRKFVLGLSSPEGLRPEEPTRSAAVGTDSLAASEMLGLPSVAGNVFVGDLRRVLFPVLLPALVLAALPPDVFREDLLDLLDSLGRMTGRCLSTLAMLRFFACGIVKLRCVELASANLDVFV